MWVDGATMLRASNQSQVSTTACCAVWVDRNRDRYGWYDCTKVCTQYMPPPPPNHTHTHTQYSTPSPHTTKHCAHYNTGRHGTHTLQHREIIIFLSDFLSTFLSMLWRWVTGPKRHHFLKSLIKNFSSRACAKEWIATEYSCCQLTTPPPPPPLQLRDVHHFLSHS